MALVGDVERGAT